MDTDEHGCGDPPPANMKKSERKQLIRERRETNAGNRQANAAAEQAALQKRWGKVKFHPCESVSIRG